MRQRQRHYARRLHRRLGLPAQRGPDQRRFELERLQSQQRDHLHPVAGTTYKFGVYGYGKNNFGKHDIRVYPGPVQPVTYTLTTGKSGSGSGTVYGPELADPNCGDTCSVEVNDSGYVILRAVPDEGSVFVGWENAPYCRATASTCSFRIYSDRTPTAVFKDTVPKTLSVDIQGTGAGTVTSSPGSIDCPGTCEGTFEAGETVTLTATPKPGSKFSGWSDDCSGVGQCVVQLDQASSVDATFSKVTAATPLRLKAGKPKLNKKNGTVLIPVTVNAAAKITLSGKNLKKKTAATKGAKTVRMAVVPVRKLKKALRKKGKAVAKLKITARPTAGGATKTVTRKITLRLKKRR